MKAYPILHEPIVLNPSTDVLFEPFIILNPSANNKITPINSSQESEHHRKHKRNNNFIQVRSNDTESQPLYMDIDVSKSPGQRSSQNINDLYTLQINEHDVKDCIDLHLLVHFRKKGVNAANQIWDRYNTIKQYFHITDGNLMMVLEKKCNLASNILNQSVQYVEQLPKVKQAHKVPEINNFKDNHKINSNYTYKKDSDSLVSSIKPETLSVNNESDILENSYHNKLDVHLEPNIILNKKLLNTKSMVFRSLNENQKLNKTKISKNTPDNSIQPIVSGQELDRNEVTLSTSVENKHEYIENEILHRQKKINKTQYNNSLYEENYENSLDNETRKIKNDINSTQNTIDEVIDSLEQNKSNVYLVTAQPTTTFTNEVYYNTSQNIGDVDYTNFLSSKHDIKMISMNNATRNSSEGWKQTSNYSHNYNLQEGLKENYNIDLYNPQTNNMLTEATESDDTIKNSTEGVLIESESKKSNATKYFNRTIPENDVRILRIDVTKHTNDTVSTFIDVTENELHIDHGTNNLETNDMKRVLNEKNNYDSEISGNLYFMFKKLLIPMRFVQAPDGRLNLTIDGTSFCENLVKDKKFDNILSTICNVAVNNNIKQN
nr:homeobox-like protein HDP1 isoform X2 [Plodia interpunctella]XP_053624844.1 homeobox-like protein HDP1 isoform X2 [Plodia interpunctella]